MKNIISKLLLIVALLNAGISLAQQDPMFTQSFDNMIYVNPAYAGSRGMLNFTDINRVQWVGFDGNPRSTTLSVNSPIFNESLGTGMSMVHDQLGPIKQTMLFGDIAYSIKVNDKGGKLAFGMKAGFNLININSSDLVTTDPNDPYLLQNVQNRVNVNFGAGVYYHSPKWYVGFSSPKVLKQSYDGISQTNVEQRHYFGIVGGIINLNEEWKLKPATQIRATAGAPISMDLSLAGVYRDKFWFGGLYRLDAAFGGFAQFQVSPQFKVGIASEFDTGEIRKYNTGSFELLLTYDFNFKKEGVRSPRYF
jgi:type IX secretion system PorP/SprF family membrane protein